MSFGREKNRGNEPDGGVRRWGGKKQKVLRVYESEPEAGDLNATALLDERGEQRRLARGMGGSAGGNVAGAWFERFTLFAMRSLGGPNSATRPASMTRMLSQWRTGRTTRESEACEVGDE